MIKIWNFKNYECLIDFKNIDLDLDKINQIFYSVCFLNHKNNIYILINNCEKNYPIRVYDLKKKNIKNIYININDSTIEFIKTIYDKKLSKNYIFIKSGTFCKSYNYSDDKEYHTYFKNNCNKVLIDINGDKIRIIGMNTKYSKVQEDKTIISILDFHSAKKILKIDISGILKNICLWNNEYMIGLMINNKNKTKKYILSVIDMKEGKITKDLIDTDNYSILSFFKFVHPSYGECLLANTFYFFFRKNIISILKKD